MNYIVLDFEATCDEPVNPDPQEIVEFPALLVEAQTRRLAAEFHTYVRPIEHPVLTSFCTQLTGIRQSQVDRSPPFPEVLDQFGQWIGAHGSGEFLFVTCGDWDLGSLLPRQCQQHGVVLPTWATRWANLKRAFVWNYPQAAHQTSLDAMAKALGLPWIGRAHSGIDDSRNIAQILQKNAGGRDPHRRHRLLAMPQLRTEQRLSRAALCRLPEVCLRVASGRLALCFLRFRQLRGSQHLF